MTLVIETGAGTPGANGYVSPAFILSYLTSIGRQAEWVSLADTVAKQELHSIRAAAYMDQRYGPELRGVKSQRGIAGRAAFGTLTFASNPSDGDTVTIGAKVYRLVATLAQEDDVLIGAAITDTVENIVSATIGATVALGSTVHANTQPNYEAISSNDAGTLDVECRAKGESGNYVQFETTAAGATITGSGFLADGIDPGEQPLEMPRTGLYLNSGTLVTGVPTSWKQANAEAARRSLTADLLPDVEFDDTGARIERDLAQVGPIKVDTTFSEGAVKSLDRTYPEIHRLVDQYLTSVGGTYR